MIRQTCKNAAIIFGGLLLALAFLYFYMQGVRLIADYFSPIKQIYVQSGKPVIPGKRAFIYFVLTCGPLASIICGFIHASNTKHKWWPEQQRRREAKAGREDGSV